MSIAKRLLNSLKAASAQPIYPDWLLHSAEAHRWDVPPLILPQAQAELYQRLSAVSVAVSTVANLGSLAQLNVKRQQGEKTVDIDNHPFEKLMRRPNPKDSRTEFMVGTLSYLALTGNYYWWLNRESENEIPSEMWLIPSWEIRPIPDEKLYISGYEYDPGNGRLETLPPYQICHGRRFHPTHDFIGMSMVEPFATDAQADMAMGKWNANYFGKDNAKIPGALAFSDFVQDPQWDKIKSDAKQGWGGMNRSGPMMLRGAGAGGVQWVAMAISQHEMEFLAGRQFLKEEFWSGFAPGLASMLAINANEANSRTGKGILIEFAVWPLLVSVQEKINNDILPAYGEEFVAEFEDIRITDRAVEIQEQQSFAQCHTIDEVRAEFYDDKPLGDPRGDLLPAQVNSNTPGPGMDTMKPEFKPVQETVTDAATALPGEDGQPSGQTPKPPATPGKTNPLQQQPARQTGAQPPSKQVQQATGQPNAMKADLEKWESKALNRLKRGKPAYCDFDSDSIPGDLAQTIGDELQTALWPDDVRDIFVEAAKAQRPFATRRTGLHTHDGDDAARLALEASSTEAIAAALRKVMAATISDVSNHVTVEQAIAAYQANKAPLRDALHEMLTKAAALGVDGGLKAVDQLQGTAKATKPKPTISTAWDLANTDARDWVDQYMFDFLADLDATTVKALRTAISEWIENGKPLKSLIEELSTGRGPFSPERAKVIATTEVTRAYAQGNLAAWKESGIVTHTIWRTANDEIVCPICAPLGGLTVGDDGTEPASLQDQWDNAQSAKLGESFSHPGGDGAAGKHEGDDFDSPPAHPNCRCWLAPATFEGDD